MPTTGLPSEWRIMRLCIRLPYRNRKIGYQSIHMYIYTYISIFTCIHYIYMYIFIYIHIHICIYRYMIYYEELAHTIMEVKSHSLLSISWKPRNSGIVSSSLKAEEKMSQLNQWSRKKRINTSFISLLV